MSSENVDMLERLKNLKAAIESLTPEQIEIIRPLLKTQPTEYAFLERYLLKERTTRINKSKGR